MRTVYHHHMFCNKILPSFQSVYQVYQFHTVPLLQHKSFLEREQQFYFHSLLARSTAVHLQPGTKSPHDLKMTAQCLAEITNYSQREVSTKNKMCLREGNITLLHKISHQVVYYRHQHYENKSKESMYRQAST
jgi:hypothetical protein